MAEIRGQALWASVILVLALMVFAAVLIVSGNSVELRSLALLAGQATNGAVTLYLIVKSTRSTREKVEQKGEELKEIVNGRSS